MCSHNRLGLEDEYIQEIVNVCHYKYSDLVMIHLQGYELNAGTGSANKYIYINWCFNLKDCQRTKCTQQASKHVLVLTQCASCVKGPTLAVTGSLPMSSGVM